MIRFLLYLFLVNLAPKIFAQDSRLIAPGDNAPPFVLNLEQNTIQGFTMPYQNKIVLLHFWSTQQPEAKKNNRSLNFIAEHYNQAEFINAEGFEIISIAVQSDKKSWKDCIQRDSLSRFIHGIALKGFSDDVCTKYGVKSIGTDILIDENGKVMAINPRMIDLENMLDSKRNIHPLKKDVYGILAQASNKVEISKFTKIYLFNHYGDSTAFTRSNEKGEFMFHEVRLNQDFILKVDNQIDIVTSDPLAIYTKQGELLSEGKTSSGGFAFYIPAKVTAMMVEEDTSHHATHSIVEIKVTKYLEFSVGGSSLTTKDGQELSSILQLLARNKNSMLEYTTHTSHELDPKKAKELTDKQASVIKTYFTKKGIQLSRIRALSKGDSEPRIPCVIPESCTESENKQNRRVEFAILKN